jgi:hypothetical protein
MARKSLTNRNLDGLTAKQVVSSIVDARFGPSSFLTDQAESRAFLIKAVIENLGRKYGIPFRTEAMPIQINE